MLHAWGMTEMTPLGTRVPARAPTWTALPEDERYAIRAKQGTPVAGVDMRIVDDARHGAAVGRQERGRDPGARALGHQRLLQQPRAAPPSSPRTAGSAPATWPRIDPDGYIQITDRTKDLIKSGGEWISSVDMETTIMGHPKVLEAAVIAVPHPRVGGAAARLRGAQARVQGPAHRRRRSSTTSRRGWPSGGCPTRSSSSTRCPRPASASSTRRSSASASRTGSRRPRSGSGLTFRHSQPKRTAAERKCRNVRPDPGLAVPG